MHYRNLAELHRRRADRLGPRTALRFRRHGLFHDVTWEQYRADALACAAALVAAGVRPGDRVGLLSDNRVEWLLADMGILAAAAINVPPHAPLTARQIQYQFADAGISWLFVSGGEPVDKVRAIRVELPALRGVVVFDRGVASGDEIAWPAFLQRGRRSLEGTVRQELVRREEALGRDDLATIMYTSGTTGNPKGVMLTHGNLLSNACAAVESFPSEPDDVVLTWLPFSHIYARTVDHYQRLVAGNPLVLAGSAETLIQDLADVQPTHLSAVPRFFEKVLTAVASSSPEETGRKLRAVYGPRVKWLTSGGAPLPLPIGEAYHAAGIEMLQGYGLTESAPVISFNRPGRSKLGTVGEALSGVEIAIAPDGEILTRGPHVMKGYWNNPQATAEAIRDGWLHTGDLGTLDADGHLKITGRKKELMVLSNGKKVVPPFIEGLILSDPCLDQVIVCGEGRNFLTALVVPHWENLGKAMRTNGLAPDGDGPESLARRPDVAAFLQQRIEAALRDVSSWERVKKIAVLPRPFSVENEELTVSLKLRRSVVLQRYAEQVDKLYRD
jgi:long-chain acyl-CoA synthetase